MSALTDQGQPKRTVLLTGSTGFLGSYLLKALCSAGYKVVILKRSTSDTWRIASLLNQVTSYNIDRVSLNEAFEGQCIDVVLHTACCYGRNGESIQEVVETNLMFGLKLLDAAVLFKTSTFINTDTLLPKDLSTYTLSKKQFVEWSHQYTSKIQIINFKLEHVYGPLDDSKKFIPWLLNQFAKGVEKINLTKGDQLRDFIYVDDVVSAYMIALKKTQQLPVYSEFDVATGVLTSVRSMVEMVNSAYSLRDSQLKTKLVFGALSYRNGELMRVDVNNTPLLDLGWEPLFEPNAGINKILELDFK